MSASTDPYADLGFDVEVSGGEEPPVYRGTSIRNALPKGLYKGAQSALQFYSILPKGPISAEVGSKLAEKVLPTQDRFLENQIERAGKIIPQVAGGGIVRGALGVGLGTLGGGIAEALGAGETGQNIAEIASMLGPNAVSGIKKLFTAPTAQMTSGLTPPKALGSKHVKKGTITPERKEELLGNKQSGLIGSLNKEAGEIADRTLRRHVPLVDRIRSGYNFKADFARDFGEVDRLAAQANPRINILPVKDLLRDTILKYNKIPKLHPDAKNIMSEIKAFAKAKAQNPNTGLDQLIKIRRSNTKKMNEIYEKSYLHGKKKEYVDFLGDMNKAIDKSIKDTLPQGSHFVDIHERSLKGYSEYQNALKAESSLKSIISGEITPGKIAKLANDPEKHKRLTLYMGKAGADEISQLAKDLDAAQKSIHQIPVKKLSEMDKILPLALLLDISKIPKALVVGPKVFKGARALYGNMLSSPQRINQYRSALRAFNEGDVGAYRKAAQDIVNAIGGTIEAPKRKSKESDLSDLGFESD